MIAIPMTRTTATTERDDDGEEEEEDAMGEKEERRRKKRRRKNADSSMESCIACSCSMCCRLCGDLLITLVSVSHLNTHTKERRRQKEQKARSSQSLHPSHGLSLFSATSSQHRQA